MTGARPGGAAASSSAPGVELPHRDGGALRGRRRCLARPTRVSRRDPAERRRRRQRLLSFRTATATLRAADGGALRGRRRRPVRPTRVPRRDPAEHRRRRQRLVSNSRTATAVPCAAHAGASARSGGAAATPGAVDGGASPGGSDSSRGPHAGASARPGGAAASSSALGVELPHRDGGALRGRRRRLMRSTAIPRAAPTQVPRPADDGVSARPGGGASRRAGDASRGRRRRLGRPTATPCAAHP